MCCHPALTPASAIPLTLRAVGGLTTARDRGRVPRARGDDGPAHQPGQGDGQGVRTSRSRCRRRDERRRAAALRAPRPLPALQRGLREQRRARPRPHRPLRRGDPAHPRRCTAALPDDPEVGGPARADAAHRRPPPGPHRRRRRARPARRAGPHAVGPRLDRRGRRADHRGRCATGQIGEYQLQAAIAAVHDQAAALRGHRLARDPRRSTACSSA